VDDPKIHSGYPVWIRSISGLIALHLDLGGDVDVEPSTVCEQGHRSDRVSRIRDLTGEAHL
jgi:hypothetical protein